MPDSAGTQIVASARWGAAHTLTWQGGAGLDVWAAHVAAVEWELLQWRRAITVIRGVCPELAALDGVGGMVLETRGEVLLSGAPRIRYEHAIKARRATHDYCRGYYDALVGAGARPRIERPAEEPDLSKDRISDNHAKMLGLPPGSTRGDAASALETQSCVCGDSFHAHETRCPWSAADKLRFAEHVGDEEAGRRISQHAPD